MRSGKLAEFVGICLGDGCAWGYQVSVTLNATADVRYVPYVQAIAKDLFPGATVTLVKRRDNAVDVRVNSKDVVRFMQENGIVSNAKFVPSWIAGDINYAVHCIRGLFDTEGSISFKTYLSKGGLRVYKQLNFRNIDVRVMLFVRNTLVRLGLKPTLTPKKSLYLSSHQSIAAFQHQVGFGNPKLFEKSLIMNALDYQRIEKVQYVEA